MRLVLIFSSILCLSCVVGLPEPSSHPVKDIIELVVMFVELTVQHIGNIDLIQNTSIFLDVNNPDALEGIVKFQKIRITGLDNLKVDRSNIDFNYTDSIFSFCANLSIANTTSLEIVDYDADIAILNEIPLYGNGKLSLGLNDIDFALCAKIDLANKPVQLTDFLLKPSISGLAFELTGFWNNPQLSEAITNIVVSLEKPFTFFWTNEINCITCILSISLEHMINDLLNPSTSTMDLYEIAEITRSDCKGDCVASNNPFLTTIFTIDPLDLLIALSKDEKVKEYLYSIESYLNEYLEEYL